MVLQCILGSNISFKIIVFSGYMHRSRVSGSYGSSIFRFLRNPHIVLHMPVYILTNRVGEFPFFYTPSSMCYLMMVILTSVRWYLIVVSIFISLVVSNVEHIFMCFLVICMPSLEKCLFRPSAHFLIGLFGFCFCFF